MVIAVILRVTSNHYERLLIGGSGGTLLRKFLSFAFIAIMNLSFNKQHINAGKKYQSD